MIADTTIKRPALRYYGGKWNLAPWIISHFPPRRSPAGTTRTVSGMAGPGVRYRPARIWATWLNCWDTGKCKLL